MDRIDEVVGEAARRLRALEPSTIAILVTGSYAKGTADEDSDLDIRAVTDEEPVIRYRTWFQDRPGAKPLHVSAGAKTATTWLRERELPQEWTLGFPGLYVATYVWATEDARLLLGRDPSNRHPPGPPELEDFVELLVKVRRSVVHGDAVGTRLHARGVGELAPRLLTPLNEERVVSDRREALEAALSLTVAPDHYRADISVCLGLVPAGDDAVSESALRLGRGLLAFLRANAPDVDDQPDIASYLRDGTLERHLGFANE